MSNVQAEQLKKFVFSSKCTVRGESLEEKLEIIIPEVYYFSLIRTLSVELIFSRDLLL